MTNENFSCIILILGEIKKFMGYLFMDFMNHILCMIFSIALIIIICTTSVLFIIFSIIDDRKQKKLINEENMNETSEKGEDIK